MPNPQPTAEEQIWEQWFAHMERPRKVTAPMLSLADQMAFHEIAQPIIRAAEQAAVEKREGEIQQEGFLWPDVKDQQWFTCACGKDHSCQFHKQRELAAEQRGREAAFEECYAKKCQLCAHWGAPLRGIYDSAEVWRHGSVVCTASDLRALAKENADG